jgi:hypothetical protein
MKTTNCSTLAPKTPASTGAANHRRDETKSDQAMIKVILISLVLGMAGLAGAANVPSGITGLWRFQSSVDKLKATIGVDITNSNPDNAAFLLGPWTVIGPGLSDGGVIQDRSFDYLTVNPGFTANGGGGYVNEYSIAWDVRPDPNLNSLFQTAFNGNDNDGDLWIDATTPGAATIGVDDVGYSASTFDATKWHRIVLSVDNGSYFRVYVDGVLFLDGAGQPVDGRFSLYPDRFHLFADNDWQDVWILAGNVMTWNRALTTEEVAGMGGWINDAAEPTPLLFNETPVITSVSPADGETNASPNFSYRATILDGSSAQVVINTVQLKLDDLVLSPSVTKTGVTTTVSFSAGGLLRRSSTHTYRLTYSDTGAASYTNDATFTVQNYTGYEWRFTLGDLSPALGNGILDYADPGNAGLTSFGTTDGSTVPHISGTPAKYIHVPAFTSDTDGYYLNFADSGPNTGTNAFLNRYTILFDVLVPGPLDWTAFFNTDPYNLNDADFYLAADGSIGIGGGGYSAIGVITPGSWNRIAFVADLEANTLTYYVNGTNVKTRAADGIGGRWALYSNQDFGPDLLLFNEGDTSGTYTHELYLSSVAFADRGLSANEIAGLGSAQAKGIFVPSFAPKPTLSIQQSGGGVVVSWPTNYVGYALEQTDSLIAPQWQPVAGITNNAVTISAGGASTFYQLAQ